MKKNILSSILEHSKKTKSIICARRSNDEDSLYVGYIVDFTETIIIMQQITTYGLEDGLFIESIDNIETFEFEDEYAKSFQFLFENQSKIKKQTIHTLKLPKSKNWKFEMLKNFKNEAKIITIILSAENITIHGFIIDFDENMICLNPISKLGENQGKVTYKLNDISSLTIDELESRKRKAFYDWRNKK
jgi:hypothetical protein